MKGVTSILNPKAWENTNIVQVIKERRLVLCLPTFSKRLSEKDGKAVECSRQQEMLQGIESAKEISAQLILADRQIQITFRRIWKSWDYGER